MVINSCSVVVCDGQPVFLVNEITDERGVEYEGLRAHLVASHAFIEGGDFGGGEGCVPDSDFGDLARGKTGS
jgi:hypothetical protein